MYKYNPLLVGKQDANRLGELEEVNTGGTATPETEDIYITYPATGEKKTVTVGTLVIDFLVGEVTLPDGTIERTSNPCDEVMCLSVDVNKAATITLDSGGKYPIGANQLFSIERQKFRTVYIEFSEVTEVAVWASTNKEGAIRVEKPTTTDSDERRYTRRIEYDGSNNPIYEGEAKSGSGESELKWRIKKLSYSGSNVTQITWCDGSEGFRFAWSDRAAYSYS